MRIPRMTLVTLGVADLNKAIKFYRAVLATPPMADTDGIAFFQLPGVWLALYPVDKLAEDIAPGLAIARDGFLGVTLAHNARSKEEVEAIMHRAEQAGARVAKEPQPAFWGGFSGYFADPDGHHWEVAWGPMFAFDDKGEMRWQDGA